MSQILRHQSGMAGNVAIVIIGNTEIRDDVQQQSKTEQGKKEAIL
jgi:hypothetical protein